MGREVWRATAHGVAKESYTIEQLNSKRQAALVHVGPLGISLLKEELDLDSSFAVISVTLLIFPACLCWRER